LARAFHTCRAPNTCGVGIVSMFRKDNASTQGTPLTTYANPGGCGWLMAGFISNTDAKNAHGDLASCMDEAYEQLKKKYKMMDQYPVRQNDNSDNKFFFVIYDTKSKLGPQGRAEHNAQFKWPF
jgi:hypothetical protein